MSKKNTIPTAPAKNSGSGKAKAEAPQKTIALNRSARHDFHLEDRYEAGIALQGWEMKSIRAGRLNMGDAYAMIKNGEIFLFGAQITPLIQASTHVITTSPPPWVSLHSARSPAIRRRRRSSSAGSTTGKRSSSPLSRE